MLLVVSVHSLNFSCFPFRFLIVHLMHLSYLEWGRYWRTRSKGPSWFTLFLFDTHLLEQALCQALFWSYGEGGKSCLNVVCILVGRGQPKYRQTKQRKGMKCASGVWCKCGSMFCREAEPMGCIRRDEGASFSGIVWHNARGLQGRREAGNSKKSHCHKWQYFIFSYGWVVFHGIYAPHLLYPIIYQRTLTLFLCLRDHE